MAHINFPSTTQHRALLSSALEYLYGSTQAVFQPIQYLYGQLRAPKPRRRHSRLNRLKSSQVPSQKVLCFLQNACENPFISANPGEEAARKPVPNAIAM